ncbi:hypothetical protein PAAG_04556 [Paracoccidioides lutzii Pb01]|uniref:Uncharacterized protein n=1 Tax=Paracoccidioides lutzii (strain ATCC MYA-826 / Pb01) TaxID=502779 RepID=C1H1B2_PARBA|nr:hypothetical protein PAAG_04556 [Paracoccidioides lutzii Pb01]EEH33506.2 hypothetical protein PAAG_04556 [Paracoccidioides lutzii Pb01]
MGELPANEDIKFLPSALCFGNRSTETFALLVERLYLSSDLHLAHQKPRSRCKFEFWLWGAMGIALQGLMAPIAKTILQRPSHRHPEPLAGLEPHVALLAARPMSTNRSTSNNSYISSQNSSLHRAPFSRLVVTTLMPPPVVSYRLPSPSTDVIPSMLVSVLPYNDLGPERKDITTSPHV